VVSFLQISPPKSCTRLSPPPSELHAPPTSFPRFYHPHNIGLGVQIMELLASIYIDI
jgi:hypothetical protein